MDHDGDTDGELLSLLFLLLLLTLRSFSVMSSERSCYFLINPRAQTPEGTDELCIMYVCMYGRLK